MDPMPVPNSSESITVYAGSEQPSRYGVPSFHPQVKIRRNAFDKSHSSSGPELERAGHCGRGGAHKSTRFAGWHFRPETNAPCYFHHLPRMFFTRAVGLVIPPPESSGRRV
ncbi:hypothetical protein EVAR_48055_1 [Eumeta japonica]|uniref:Uncharacterized protein n=1 Tax=Eumeta variegata TaxID=151549 RepID=A0A4C1X7Q4_EUMVA|nr:hypothetical protein EVAR_48055_1 [Eumeta japonica]